MRPNPAVNRKLCIGGELPGVGSLLFQIFTCRLVTT